MSPGDLLRGANLESLTVLDGADEGGSVVEVVDGSGIEPGGSTWEDGDAELLAL